VGEGIGPQVASQGWLFLAPVSAERASYSPLLFLLLVAASFALSFVLVRRLYHGRLRRAAPWDCGFPLLQCAHAGHGRGFSASRSWQVFEPFFRMQSGRQLPSPFDRQPSYRMEAGDHLWHWLYLPVARASDGVSRLGRPACSRADLDLPDVQLRHAAGDMLLVVFR